MVAFRLLSVSAPAARTAAFVHTERVALNWLGGFSNVAPETDLRLRDQLRTTSPAFYGQAIARLAEHASRPATTADDTAVVTGLISELGEAYRSGQAYDAAGRLAFGRAVTVEEAEALGGHAQLGDKWHQWLRRVEQFSTDTSDPTRGGGDLSGKLYGQMVSTLAAQSDSQRERILSDVDRVFGRLDPSPETDAAMARHVKHTFGWRAR